MKKWLLPIILVLVISFTQFSESKEYDFPSWVLQVSNWWKQGLISDQEYQNFIDYLINEGIAPPLEKTIKIENEKISLSVEKDVYQTGEKIRVKITNISDDILYFPNSQFGVSLHSIDGIHHCCIALSVITQIESNESTTVQLNFPSAGEYYISSPHISETISITIVEDVEKTIQQDCSGTAKCFTGYVTKILDGDTIKVDGQSIRFALASAPELSEPIGIAARSFIAEICPVGSKVIVDEDDGQPEGSYGRVIAKITCNGILLNQAIVDQGFGTISREFCGVTEFSNEAWTGCSEKSTFTPSAPSTTQSSCDPSYPDFCIPSPPPDLDCKDIPQKRFTVIGSDPHRFDGDKDGIGCES